MTNRTAAIDPQITSLVARLLERRKLTLFQEVRHERKVIAERMAAANTLRSGAFVVAVTQAFKTGFEAYARGSTDDVLALMRQSGGNIDVSMGVWIKEQLEPAFESTAEQICGEVGGGALSADLQSSVTEAMKMSLASVKRDLGIELDLAAIARAQPAPAIDMALRDSLVPLQNSRGLELEFQACSGDSDQPMAFVLFDVDHFKQVNDAHGGHATGNEALVSIAQVAAGCVKGKGKAYRLHGDEFVLLLPNHTLQEGLAVAERFRSEVNTSPKTSQNLTLSASVGVAVWPADGGDLAALQKAADAAMYDAKNRGGNLVRYYGEPEPSVAVPGTERKQPEPGGLSADEQLKILQDYFVQGAARCPRDRAVLTVQDTTAFGQSTRSINVSCPLCGLSAHLN